MRYCRAQIAWPLAIPLLLASGPSHALTIWAIGAPGETGAVGVDGTPGDPADAVANSLDPINSAIAQAGRGGYGGAGAAGGAAGAASAVAETNVCEPAGAFATATAGAGGGASGAGGIAADGGAATAQASVVGVGGSEAGAFATGGVGGQGEAGARAGDGGAALLADAVSGSDAVALSLAQSAEAGTGGRAVTLTHVPRLGYVYFGTGTGGSGGDARSTGDFTNTAGGDLLVSLEAIGGDGGWGLERGVGGAAHVGGSATSVGSGDASLVVIARTGSGFQEGAIEIDPVVASATGTGDASVDLDARLGAAWGNPYNTTPSASLSLVNRVQAFASQSAVVTLRQSATASGGAESILDVSKSAARLDLEANASGGDASIVVRGTNDAGGLRLSGMAVAGAAHEGGEPLDAHAVFEAVTSGDGHDIEIGYAGRPAGAVGGSANHSIEAGNARLDATATAFGNSAVRIDVSALGGDGSDFLSGDALVIAEGHGGGAQPVHVFAAATGSDAFYGRGGDAHAEASASGAGEAVARAVSSGGITWGRLGYYDGSAFARAQASGSVGYAEAIASSERLYDGEQADDDQVARVLTAIRAAVSDGAVIAASTHFHEFAACALDPDIDASLQAAYTPAQALRDEALSGNPRAASAPFARPGALSALVEFRASAREGVTQTFTANIMLGSPYGGFEDFDPKPEGILVSFLDPEIDAAGFGSLTLRSWDTRAPGDVHEVNFASALEALAFLDDGRLVFGGEPRERILELVFETSGLEGELFLDFIVAAVPEPGLPILLGLAGLIGAGHRRYRCGVG